LIEKVVNLTKNDTPIALIGAGGIGKTSIALAVLHHDRIKQRFRGGRRFIHCGHFPPSRAHLLYRLSNVIGAGIENAEDLTPLRASLSSEEMLIVFDNVESILNPQVTDAEEIYAVLEELSQFNNIRLCITSQSNNTRLRTAPAALPGCKRLDVPTLSMDAAQDTFCRIYGSGGLHPRVGSILEQLDFHPLSITLLAAVACQNKWDTNQLAREWERRRTSVLQTQHSKNLAATIELSLTSPAFQELGPNARALLGVIAFFPLGVDENNLAWLFPTIWDRTNIFDQFCTLSLTYRSNGFFTMLAPLRNHLSPKDPNSSPLLCTTKDRYFARLSVDLDPRRPGFEEARWITSEDVNVEHLLDAFISTDVYSGGVWDACCHFMGHLRWHKPRPTILGPKIEGLPDDHPSKSRCLFELSRLFHSVGHLVESKRLLSSALELYGERGDDLQVARVLGCLPHERDFTVDNHWKGWPAKPLGDGKKDCPQKGVAGEELIGTANNEECVAGG